MKIAIDTLFENPDRPTGATDYLRNIASTLPRIAPRHEYYLLTSHRNLRIFKDIRHPSLHFVHCFYSNENIALRVLVQQTWFPVLMKLHKFDVLFAPGNVCPCWGNTCCVLKINTLHHCRVSKTVGNLRTMYRTHSFRASARRAAHIIANTNVTKQEICKHMGVPGDKVTVIAEPMYDIYSPVPRDQAREALRTHGLIREYVLFVSSLYAYKNTETLIKAFAILVKAGGAKASRAELDLVIVGQDFDLQLPKLLHLASTLGIAERVHFPGFVPTEHLPAIYSSAKVFVFPSLEETFGKPLVEAMRCGVPVVASNASCIPEVLGGAGLLVNPLNAQEMGSAIAQALDDDVLRADLIARGLARANDFSLEDAAKHTIAVIERTFEAWKLSRDSSQVLAHDAYQKRPGGRCVWPPIGGRVKYFVTGGAGFIGSTFVDRLLTAGHEVAVFDNFSTGYEAFLEQAAQKSGFTLTRGDLLDTSGLARAMRGCDFVFHFAANADVRFGADHPRKDMEQNTLATLNVLEAMRTAGINRIAFSSTGSIYGEPAVFPTSEDTAFPVQTSLYGASKLACEGLISAYCEAFGFNGWIFRFVSILGERYTHGHVFDFYKQLREHPESLQVLGDGQQRKSYLYIQDCVDAVFTAIEKARGKINIFNLGTDEYCAVNDSIGWMTGELGLSPRISYSGGTRGWIGDSPFIFLDCSRVRSLGWQPKLTIRQGIERTLRYLQKTPWVLERR